MRWLMASNPISHLIAKRSASIGRRSAELVAHGDRALVIDRTRKGRAHKLRHLAKLAQLLSRQRRLAAPPLQPPLQTLQRPQQPPQSLVL